MAAANATIRSTFFHPQHMLAAYHYSEASTHPCAACERVVTGTGYRCGECDFNIHEACLSLPQRVNFDGHPGHALTLIRLGANRWCDLCEETSLAGRYMYLCEPCNFDVHPRCTTLVAQPQRQQPQPQPQPQPPRGAHRSRGAFRVLKASLKIGIHLVHLIDNPLHVVHLLADLFTDN
ncbi:protein VACUOLELESS GAMETOPHYTES-like [Phragmites australis]|uniref:protein VACUOLELESS GAMETOPHYTES-like n=1 Tax=Phragmites australis TaxID=29695 RepID=UPI002D783682|nr:protein VACUOLELESS GAMETOPHYTES-like [Phragmites australis]